MNYLHIIGNLTRDPELRTTPNGKTVCSFDLAVRREQKREGQPEADFFRVNVWGSLGEICAKYLAKGRKAAVTGSISLSKREKDGKFYASLEVMAKDVEFLSPKQEGQQEGQKSADFGTIVEDAGLPF